MIVDDHTLFRHGMVALLESAPGIVVVGQTGTGSEAVSLAAHMRPDVLLLDVEMPGESASETVKRLASISPNTRVIVVSMFDSPYTVQRLLREGVRGYLLKEVAGTDLISAVHGVASDPRGVVLSISPGSLAQLNGFGASVLSPREREVLTLAAQAYTNAQIADRLDVREGTIKRHFQSIFDKLGAVSRLDAVNKARARALIDPGDAAP
jgi:DNA-binding NarL/FixJ family response regulator